jgi:hypothetical protein
MNKQAILKYLCYLNILMGIILICKGELAVGFSSIAIGTALLS